MRKTYGLVTFSYLAVIISVSALPPTPSIAGPSIAGLHVSGSSILNSLNQAVILRGVNVAGAAYMCQAAGSNLAFDGPTDQASVDALKSWNINVVRIPVNEDCWLGINGQPSSGQTAAQYQAAITTYINLLNSNGIAVIFDLQFSAPGTALGQNTLPMPDADHSSAFWTSVANTYKNNSSVIFDLFNEPWPDNNNISSAAWTCLKNGVTCLGVSYTAVGMQSLVDTVRATGATNILMIPGITYANTLDQWLTYKPTDPLNNLAASWHSYAGQYCSGQSCWDSQIAPVAAAVPLIAGEIGESDCAATFINPLMTWLDAHNANYLGWAWATYDCSAFPSLISNYDGTPTPFGQGLHDHLLALTGSPAPIVSLSVSPNSIVSGQFATLTWSSTNATSCTGTDFAASGTSGSTAVAPTSNTIYSITCTGTEQVGCHCCGSGKDHRAARGRDDYQTCFTSNRV